MPTETPKTHWQAVRQMAGLSQREVERRLGWAKDNVGHGSLSLIERGVAPTPEQEAQLKAFYREVLL